MNNEYQVKVLRIEDVGYLPRRIFKKKIGKIYGIVCTYNNNSNYNTLNEIPIRSSEDYNPYSFRQLCYLLEDLSDLFQEIYQDQAVTITTNEAFPRQFEETNLLEVLGLKSKKKTKKKQHEEVE